MNSTFKISALAVLVSVSLTACSGYKDKSPVQSTPTVINKQDNIKKPVQPKQNTKPEQPKPEMKPETKAEQPQPTPIPNAISNKPEVKPEQPKPEVKPEPKITQKGKSVTTDELPTAHFKNGKGITANDLPEGKLPEPEKIISLDSQGIKWRVVNLDGSPTIASDKLSYEYNSANFRATELSNLWDDHPLPPNHQCDGYPAYSCAGNVIFNRNQGSNGLIQFNLDELAQKDGKAFVGLHQGEIYDADLYGSVVEAYNNEKGELVTKRTPANEKPVKYIFANQPYSSYGMIYTNGNDITSFSMIQNTGEAGNNEYSDFDAYRQETVTVNGRKENHLIWNDNIKGSATYKGDVIATYQTSWDTPHFKRIRVEPKLDGTVTLKANFGDRWSRSYVSGEVESKTLGKVTLERLPIHKEYTNTLATDKHTLRESAVAYVKGEGDEYVRLDGNYAVKFGGKDLNDAVGSIYLDRPEGSGLFINSGITKYNAVFGATKQPK